MLRPAWTKEISYPVWILFWVFLANRLGTVVLPFLTLYATQGLGFSAAQASILLMAFGLGALLAGPAAGWFCDAYSSITTLRISLGVSLVLLFLFPWVTHFMLLVFLVFVLAFFLECFRPAAFTAVSVYSEENQKRMGFVLIRLAANLGMSVGPAVAGGVARFSFKSIFWMNAATTLLALAVLLRFFPKVVQEHRSPSRKPADVLFSLVAPFQSRKFLWFVLATMPLNILFFQHDGVMPLYITKDLALPTEVYGFVFTVNTVLIVFLEIPLNLWMTRWSAAVLMYLGSALIALGFGAMAMATTALGIYATVVIWTLGEMVLFPISSAYVAEVSTKGREGAFMGAYQFGFSLALILSAPLGFFVYEQWGANTLWYLCLLMGLVTLGLLRFFVWGHR